MNEQRAAEILLEVAEQRREREAPQRVAELEAEVARLRAAVEGTVHVLDAKYALCRRAGCHPDCLIEEGSVVDLALRAALEGADGLQKRGRR